MTLSDIIGAFRAGFCRKTLETRPTLLNSTSMAMLVMIILAGPCAAQNAPPQTPEMRDQKACAPQQREGTVGSSQNLSDKLARSEGVICPPRDVDPDIATPPPGGGRTPIIPPPGSPGGDPTVRPK
jgi:hypothetical protein